MPAYRGQENYYAKGLMSILIIGAKGNLGSVLKEIISETDEVIAWDREDIDVTDQAQVNEKIDQLKPEVIINATGFNDVDACEEKLKYALARKINGLAVGYLAKAAIASGAILVNYSSNYVFSGREMKGYREHDKPKPINKYGRTKLLGERELIKRVEQGLKWYLIRTSKLFGPIGKSRHAKHSFFDLMLKASKKKQPLKVVDEEVSCFTYTKDLAQATKELITSKKEYGIYHITNSLPCTWYEAARELFKITGSNIEVKKITSAEFPRPARRPKYSALINTKLEPLRDWREALEEYLINDR